MRVSATIPIKALTRKATTGVAHRRMPEAQRAYYNELYAALVKAGFKCFPVAKKGDKEVVELRYIKLEFHFKDKGWRDWDNLIKGFQDAGQPSKWWLPKKERKLKVVTDMDLWDDKQFDGTDHSRRVRGSDGDYIVVEIEEVADV